MSNPKINVLVTMNYPNHVKVRLASKKNGSTIPQLFETLHLVSYRAIEPENLQRLYERGDIDENITSLRKVFIKTNGEWGISRTAALRCYKIIFSKLPKDVVRRETFDKFTRRDLNEPNDV